MPFVLRSLLLLGSLVWLIYSGKQLIGLGVLDDPSLIIDDIALALEALVAAILFKSALGNNNSRS